MPGRASKWETFKRELVPLLLVAVLGGGLGYSWGYARAQDRAAESRRELERENTRNVQYTIEFCDTVPHDFPGMTCEQAWLDQFRPEPHEIGP